MRKIIKHHIEGGTRESHSRVQDLLHPRLAKPRRGLQILDTRMGFPRPSLNVVLDFISPFHSVVIDSISPQLDSRPCLARSSNWKACLIHTTTGSDKRRRLNANDMFTCEILYNSNTQTQCIFCLKYSYGFCFAIAANLSYVIKRR